MNSKEVFLKRAARAFLLSLALHAILFAQEYQFEIPNVEGMRWFKGNTHTHTTMSDGDSSPEVVARWYKNHGYNFLILSDHNVFTDPESLAALVDSTFLLIPGEEVTSAFQRKPVHVNGLNIPHVIPPQVDTTLLGTIQKNVDAVRAVEGVPHINHPNFGWAISYAELFHLERDKLVEIYNGHPMVHNYGGGGVPSVEEVWDRLLTAGKRLYGIAVDDAHHFQGEFSAARSNPGRGWIAIRSRALDALELMNNLESGFFYASTGVELDDFVVRSRRLEIHVRQKGDFKFRTDFIGAGGEVLQRSNDNPAIFELRGGEKYVRAKVYNSMGYVAWTQPVFVKSR